MRQPRKGLLQAFAIVVASAFWGLAAAQDLPLQFSMRVVRDVPYFRGPAANPKFHSLDLYLPEGKSGVPLMFFVHGGGWRAGDKSPERLGTFIDLFLRHGMAVASVNYRLSPAVKHPAHIQDVARAFAWMRNNAAQYNVDAGNIFVAGHSAGGHLVALLALDPKYLKKEGLSPESIKGVVSSSGVYDLADFYEPGVVPSRMEQGFGTEQEILRDASPSLKVGAAGPATPPFLITYTDSDLFGLAEQAKTFYSLFLHNNLPAQLVEIPSRDHFNVISEIGNQVVVRDINGRPIVPVEDLLGPALVRFVNTVQDGSFASSFHAVWPKGGPRAVPKMSAPAMKVVRDVQYYDGLGADPKLHALDLYLPEGKTNVPVLFYVHGGRWRVGDKGNPETLVNLFGRLGWGIVSTNYSLSPAVKHPSHIQDVARAFAWVYRNASRYSIDRDRMVITGSSAGGHLVALLGLDRKYLEQEGVPPGAVKGVIPTSGIYDLAAWPEPGQVPTGREQGFGTDRETLTEASPIRYLRADAPPFLITYTDHDLYLLPEQAHRFYSEFLKRGLQARLVEIMDRAHCCPIGYMEGIGQPSIGLVDDILAVELVSFAAEVVGPTREMDRIVASREK